MENVQELLPAACLLQLTGKLLRVGNVQELLSAACLLQLTGKLLDRKCTRITPCSLSVTINR